MTHWKDHDDEDEWDDDEAGDGERLSAADLPDPSDTDGPLDDTDTVPCPFCRRPAYEFADVCPGCRNFIGGADDPTVGGGYRTRPRWFTIGVVLVLVCMLAACLVRMW